MKTTITTFLTCLLAISGYSQHIEEMVLADEPAFVETFDYGWEDKNAGIGAGDWNIAFWEQNGAEMAAERCTTNAEGHLVQTVTPGEPYKGGSFESIAEFGYGRWIARVKPSSVPGVLNSVFIKDWDDRTTSTPYNDGNHFEVDIEFLTYTFGPDTGGVHVAIHRKGEDNVLSEVIPLDFNPSDEFHDWGFDISSEWVKWHVDGEVIKTWYPEEGYTIPATAYEMFFNSWTKEEWILGPPTDTAYYHIDQVQFWEALDQPDFLETFDYGWENKNAGIGAGDWNIAFWEQNGAEMAVERCTTNVEGHLIQTVPPGEPYKGGSIESIDEFGYGRWVARVKPSPVPGVLNSVFIKDWDDRTTATPYDDGNHFEVDIEFLTYTFGPDTGGVHVAIHRKGEDNVLSEVIPLDFNPSDEFHDWGFDISSEWVKWHVDGEVIKIWYPEEDYTIPATAYEMFFNSWTKEEWILGPPTDTAYYHIDQVQFWDEETLSLLDDNASGGSEITIYAAGVSNTETMELRIDGQTAETWTNIGGAARAREFVAYRYQTEESVTASQLQVAFVNDGAGKDLRVDRIEVDGVVYQTEAPTTYSTGTYSSGTGCAGGFKGSEWLQCGGYFAYDQESTTIVIYAAGVANTETMELRVDGQTVKSWSNVGGVARAREFVSHTYTTAEAVAASQLQVAFVNDGAGKDLRVDRIEVDGTVYQTEAPTTYSTGTYSSGTGCAGGFKSSEWLQCGGYFAYEQTSTARRAEPDERPGQVEVVKEGELRVYPNPVQDELHVVLAGGQGESVIVLTDMLGRRVVERRLSGVGRPVSVSVGELPRGLYQLSVQQADDHKTFKIVIK